MNLSLRDIRYVLKIAEEGSITRAAQLLHIAQPSLSQALKRIESETGAMLFTRAQNQMLPTAEGLIFIETGREILSMVDQMRDKVKQSTQSTVHTIRLGLTFFIGSYLFPKIRASLIERAPDAVVHLVEASSSELEEKLVHGEIDLALLPAPLLNESLQSYSLCTAPMLLLLSKDDELNKFAYRKPGAELPYLDIHLANHRDFLVGKPGQRVRLINEMIFKKAGISPNLVFCSQSIDTIKRVTAAGGGISVIPEFYIERQGGAKDLNCYNLEPEYSVEWALLATYLDRGSLSLFAKEVIGIAKDICGTTFPSAKL